MLSCLLANQVNALMSVSQSLSVMVFYIIQLTLFSYILQSHTILVSYKFELLIKRKTTLL